MTGTARRGRPPVNSGPVVAIAFDGVSGAWCDGVFAGDPQVVTSAQLAADLAQEVPVFGTLVIADSTTPSGALAALISYRPGRAFVTEAPAGLLGELAGDRCGAVTHG